MDIEKLIQKGESENTEFKQNFDRGTIETVVAFANTKGGIILIGVSDNVNKDVLKRRGKGRNVYYELAQLGQNRVKIGSIEK